MAPEHRYMVAFIGAALKTGKLFTHVYDHGAQREIAVGGMVRPDRVEVIENATGARVTGSPDSLLHTGSNKHIQLKVEPAGFSGYDYASEKHFKGVLGDKGAVQVFDHETDLWHNFHVS